MNPKQVFETVLSRVARLPPPWHKHKRGRPYRTQPREYAALLVVARLNDWSTRQIEAISDYLLGRAIDHASAAWALAKVLPGYLELLIKQVYNAIVGSLTQLFHVGDSTGVRTDRTRIVERVFRQGKEIEDLKLHVLATWLPKRHAIAIATASCTRGERHDSPALRELLQRTQLRSGKKLLLDRAYDGEKNFELAFEMNLIPLIKRRANSRRGFYRRKAAKYWNECIYQKQRSRVETVFAGTQARNGNRVCERLTRTRRRAVVLLAVAHNLRTAIRLGVQALETFIRQTPFSESI